MKITTKRRIARKPGIIRTNDLKDLAIRDRYISFDNNLDMQLKRCYITCRHVREDCLPKDCLECVKNIQRKRTIDDIEAVRR